MITRCDYFIIGVYLVFLVAIGLVFRRMSRNTPDSFRAGGAMPWWLTGAAAWIFSFSAWTFTGAMAGLCAQDVGGQKAQVNFDCFDCYFDQS
jgi:Na+/proline symporter